MKWYNKLSRREQNIMKVAALVAILFLLSQGVPGLRQYYSEGQREISQLRDAIARETRLIEETDRWLGRQQELNTIRPTMDDQIFSGDNAPLIAAAIQRQVREIASEYGINITANRLAEAEQGAGWLRVNQGLSFSLTDQNALLPFFEALEAGSPYLGVSAFSLRRTRNQYTGEMTVVGFSPMDNMDEEQS
ncbi:hypothetical protein GCM10011403_15930 [Pseudohongiella nitratireducens]|uniref:General secretion pathway protein M n=1 Tax=Pseudohongiella nitratireducens TaxID=1768907 RepID=A0A917GWH4_9GAMM|nr:GspMb/PilO family protein [Pseudohongiella nitratireducens]MDF1624183.1 GspMb/PilO family protein [Pseudohongiella nitratireducens]GGG59371.1 hypothetical protein GCM10011403_15930 [Pseudohongiella nitratireducens]